MKHSTYGNTPELELRRYFYFLLLSKTKRFYLPMTKFGLAVKKVLKNVTLRMDPGGIETREIDKNSGNPKYKNILETMIMAMRLLSPVGISHDPN